MKRWWLLILGVIASVTVLLIASVPGLSEPQIALSANPSLNEVVPFEQPMSVSLKFDDAGKSPEGAAMQVKLLTPPRTPWLTTDFPIVEGTTLLEATVAAPDGEAQLQFVPPIRGRYKLAAKVVPEVAGAFTPFAETFNFRVSENPEKYRNLFILLFILGVAGFGGGWVIGGSQTLEAGEVVPQPVRMLLSVAALVAICTIIYVAATAEIAHSHTTAKEPSAVESQPHPASLTVSLEDVAIARVGQAIPLEIKINDAATGRPVTNVDLAIATTLLEDSQTVMAFQATPDKTGKYIWKQQFFDGSPHAVRARVSPQPDSAIQFKPFDLIKRIEVEAVPPPLSVRFISLGYFTAFLAAGVGVGFWARRRLQGSII